MQGALAEALAPLVARHEQPKHRKGKGGAQTPSNHKQTLSAEVTESIRPSGSLDSTSSPAAGDGVSASSTTSDMAGVGATASRAYTGHSVTVMCAGRTDRGVSAHGMVRQSDRIYMIIPLRRLFSHPLRTIRFTNVYQTGSVVHLRWAWYQKSAWLLKLTP